MKGLSLRRPLEDEFVVDETPLPVDGGPTGEEKAPSDADARRETPLGDVEQGRGAGEHGDDLFSLVSKLQKEHEALSHLTRRLEARSQQIDELEPFVVKLLPFLDSFERVLALAREHDAGDEISNWLRSVEGIYFRVTNLLEAVGLVALPAVGHTVDLNLHEVVEVQRAPDHPAGVIIGERRKGYAFRGQLLRCAQVVVAQDGEKAG